MADVFAAVDLTTVVATVTGFIVIAVGVNMAFKAGILSKRAIRSV